MSLSSITSDNRQTVAPSSISLILIFLLCTTPFASAETNITSSGITWTFEESVDNGVFANGDAWITGPATLVAISTGGDNNQNGSMLNPSLGRDNGWDERIQYGTYKVELDISTQLPLLISAGASIVSTISNETIANNGSYTERAVVLTVLEGTAPTGTFRPPLLGSDKSLLLNKSDIDYSALRTLPIANISSSIPDLDQLAESFELPWIEKDTTWTGRFLHPSSNYPMGNYGREIAYAAGEAMLALNLDFSHEEKEKLLINIIQAGIDVYGAASLGATWRNDGGHNQGRKMVLLFAGKLLNNQEMLDFADSSKNQIFQEDDQTFIVSQAEVDSTNSSDWNPQNTNPTPYTPEDIGTPEWGLRHYDSPYKDDKSWGATYRTVSGAPTVSHALVAHIMELTNEWGHPPFFAYYDRYFDIEAENAGKGTNFIKALTRDIWVEFKNSDSSSKPVMKAVTYEVNNP